MTPDRPTGRPRLVEVAGAAGAGKSTLARRLADGSGGPTLVGTLRTSEPRHLPSVVRGTPAALVAAVGAGSRGVPLSWVEAKAVLYLAGHDPVADAPAADPGAARARRAWVLVDQGPAYSLARLLVRGSGAPAVRPGSRLWHRLLERSARLLDLVVLLHAPEEVLARRIDARDQDHEVKGMGREATDAFLAAYADAYELVLGELAARGVEVHRFDTDELDPEEALGAVQRVLDDHPVRGRRSEVDT